MPKFFETIARLPDVYRPVEERLRDQQEVERKFMLPLLAQQASRCMECGIPFCHGAGCPLENNVPETNAAFRDGDYAAAWKLLSEKSPMPEFCSRVCPALCEGSCTVSLNLEPVMIRQIEKAVSDYAFEHHWVKPDAPEKRTGKTVAVVGAGPAGLAAALGLNRLGHTVTVFEKRPQAGGLLRYGIPKFKLAKELIDRRVALMEASGIDFEYGAAVGDDLSLNYLAKRYDAVVVASGTPSPRDLPLPGRDLSGIYFALDFLNGGASAENKQVLIIGGGDTGSDCVGISARQRAAAITQIEIMPKPPVERSPSTPWPQWPYKLRTSSSHYEAGDDGHNVRRWNLQSQKFLGENGKVTGVEVAAVEWELSPTGRPLKFAPVPNSTTVIPADLVLLAMGFLKPEHKFERENIFAAGDAANGPSLVVRAIADGKKIAGRVDKFLAK
ncbi:MAG: glutamate synthase subunit beta [Planctomycetota bacterium]|jgi:glutamate synthase (NADPH/NADH) small chain|nr:glutamate synthase subunit beta [Planctomycetota bacterium]